jgi:hypothetical protein
VSRNLGAVNPTVFNPNNTLTLHGHWALQRRVWRVALPHIVAFLTLNEGPAMLNKPIGCDPDALRIGQAVRLLFKPSVGECPVPLFTPV